MSVGNFYGQLDSLSEIKEKKHRIFDRYKSIFNNVDKISFQKIDEDTQHSEWMFGLRFNEFTLQQKKDLELHLFQVGIDTRRMFYEMKKHQYISHIPNHDDNSVKLNEQCIILPSYPQLTDSQVDFIGNKILKYLKK